MKRLVRQDVGYNCDELLKLFVCAESRKSEKRKEKENTISNSSSSNNDDDNNNNYYYYYHCHYQNSYLNNEQ